MRDYIYNRLLSIQRALRLYAVLSKWDVPASVTSTPAHSPSPSPAAATPTSASTPAPAPAAQVAYPAPAASTAASQAYAPASMPGMCNFGIIFI
jgi:hypothetical protein